MSGSSVEISEHQFACESGYIRMTFALGDLVKGMSLLMAVHDKKLINDCIVVLENLKQYIDAGILYERLGEWEKAAESYIKGII